MLLTSQSNIFRSADSVLNSGGEPSMPSNFITAKFFERDAATVGRELIGKKIISNIDGKRVSGIITETASYTGKDDPDTHIYRGASSKGATWQAGSLYVYSSMGFALTTIATPPFNEGACVLIRAVKIIEGADAVKGREILIAKENSVDGPGKVSKALGITTDLNGQNMFHGCGIEIKKGIEIVTVLESGRKGSKAPEMKLLFRGK
jgi:DNA-3-methyladenine glycosylase